MKHTIKLLTVAITLVTILTLTGCPGPVTPDKPCTHEHTKTEVVEEATCTEDGLGKIVCVDCEEVIEEQVEIDALGHSGEWSNWTTTREVAYDHDGEKEHTHTCTRCGHSETETVTVSRFVAGGYDGDIPTEIENPETYRYQYNDEDDYQICLSIYSREEDTKPVKTLYFSFEKDSLSNYSEIEIDDYGIWIKLSSLLQMKPDYYNCEVKRFQTNGDWNDYEDNGNISDICWQSLTTLCNFNYKIIITNQ